MTRAGRVLTDDIRKKIEDMAETMKRPSAGKIAQKLGLKHGTVYWFMLTRGLVEKKPAAYRMKPYVRNGQTVNPYSPEHDRRMLTLRIEGKGHAEIAAMLVAEFGIPRNAHSVHNRIIMLSAEDDDQGIAA